MTHPTARTTGPPKAATSNKARGVCNAGPPVVGYNCNAHEKSCADTKVEVGSN